MSIKFTQLPNTLQMVLLLVMSSKVESGREAIFKDSMVFLEALVSHLTPLAADVQCDT